MNEEHRCWRAARQGTEHVLRQPDRVSGVKDHGVYGPALQRINDSVLDEVVFLNTIPPRHGQRCDKIKYISVAHLFAEAISHIYMETSVSPLFL